MKGKKKCMRTTFKKGNVPHNKGKKNDSDCQDHTGTEEKKVEWKRLPRDIYENMRPDKLASQNNDNVEVSVKLLRPAAKRDDFVDRYDKTVHSRANMESYRILHTKMIENLWNRAIREHSTYHPQCQGSLIFDEKKEKKFGLAWKEALTCTSCTYLSRQEKLYREVQSKTSGPNPATLNVAAQAGLMTTGTGNTGLRNILLHMNIPAPSKSSMQVRANTVNDAVTKLNQSDMKAHRAEIVKINTDLGLTKDTPIMMEADCRYNNPIQSASGKTPFQPGTQCVFTVCENESVNKKIIGVNIKNKHCKLGEAHARRMKSSVRLCPNHPGKCTANLAIDGTIGDEYTWCKETFEQFNNDEIPLRASYLTTDLDSRAGQAVNDSKCKFSTKCVNLKCSRHLSQSQRRRIAKAVWSRQMFPCKKKEEQLSMQRQFAYNLSRRCTKEYNLCYTEHCGNINGIKRKLEHVGNAIISCVQGDHSLCKKHSYACSGYGNKVWKLTFLKKGQKIMPTKGDLEKLQSLIWYRIGKKAVDATKFNTSTQKTESVNRSYSRTNPKNITWTRNVDGRIHTAVHMLNRGFANSTIQRLEFLGTPLTPGSLPIKQLRSISNEQIYHRKYHCSLKYKARCAEKRYKLEYLHRRKQKEKKTKVSYKRDCESKKLQSKPDHTYSKKIYNPDHTYSKHT